jgi:hypothetical protein
MPATCSYCGELKKCREESMEPLGIGHCFKWKSDRLESYNWVCQDCDKAKVIIRNEQKALEENKQKENQLNWKKERDKILKQHGKR